MRFVYGLLGVVFVLGAGAGGAGPQTQLVADIEESTVHSYSTDYPKNLSQVNGLLFFNGDDGVAGRELWVSDGTPSGTSMVKNIHPSAGSNPGAAMELNGIAYFAASDGVNGVELLRSDGTQAGTWIVTDINPSGDSNPVPLLAAGGLLYLEAHDGVSRGLWRTNGTPAGTLLLKTLAEPVHAGLAVLNGAVYFYTTGTGAAQELWTTDGSVAGTQLVKAVSANGSGECALYSNGTRLFFCGNDGSGMAQLWCSDGTQQGTEPATAFAFADSYELKVASIVGDDAFLCLSMNGVMSLYRSGGVPGDADLVGMVPVSQPVGWYACGIAAAAPVGDALFFGAATWDSGLELWMTSGAPATGIALVADINPGLEYVANAAYQIWKPRDSSPFGLTAFDDALFFGATGAGGTRLWRSDGTGPGTFAIGANGLQIKRNNGAAPAVAGGNLFFAGYDAFHGYELWKTDGTTAELVKDTKATTESSDPDFLINLNGRLIFQASGWLWAYDGYDVVEPLADVNPQYGSAVPGRVAVMNGVAYFAGQADCNGNDNIDLWRTDGTLDGTYRVAQINGCQNSYPDFFTRVGNYVYFRAANASASYTLWRTDGTAEGTVPVKVINPYGAAINPPDTTTFAGGNGRVYFPANDGVSGYEIWSSDGTAGNTNLVRDILPGSPGSAPVNLVFCNNVCLFTANDGTHGAELWRTDGTSAGTWLVRDIRPGCDGAGIGALTVFGNATYFAASDPVNGLELWRTDGTSLGTGLVKDIAPGAAGSSPQYLTAIGRFLYFSADDGVHGRTTWRTDGTARGTVWVGGGALPAFYTESAGSVYFSGADTSAGRELWRTNGTAGGTSVAADIYSGALSSYPAHLVDFYGALYYQAMDLEHGKELWQTFDGEPLVVTQPVGGEQWIRGSLRYVTWYAQSGSAIRVKLYRNGAFLRWIGISGTNATEFAWTIPEDLPIGGGYRVQIYPADGSAAPVLSAPFDVVASPIQVTAPNGGEQWPAGSKQTVTWSGGASVAQTVKIKVWKGSAFAGWVSPGVANTGTFQWRVGSDLAPGNDYRVQIYSSIDGTLVDSSDAPFSIGTSPMVLTAPNGGEQWQAGDTQNIAWNVLPAAGDTVKLKLFRNGGFVRWIAGSAPNTGTYKWTTPDDVVAGPGYSVQIYSASNMDLLDMSDGPFEILLAPVRLLTPNGGETWQAGVRYNITWVAAPESGGYVKLKLFKGGVFDRWISGGSANTGAYNWLIPAEVAAGDDYKVQIYAASNFGMIDISAGPFTITAAGG